MEVKIFKKRENARTPRKATEGSAGFDLYACIDHDIIIDPMKRVLIPTGVAIELPNNECAAFIFPRSGLGVNHGLTLSNSVGVIDSDYRGEILVSIINLNNEKYTIKPKDRIAQLIVMPVYNFKIEQVESLSTTNRGIGGFGSYRK